MKPLPGWGDSSGENSEPERHPKHHHIGLYHLTQHGSFGSGDDQIFQQSNGRTTGRRFRKPNLRAKQSICVKRLLTDTLQAHGIDIQGAVILNASGLTRNGRLTARQLSQVTHALYTHPNWRHEAMAQPWPFWSRWHRLQSSQKQPGSRFRSSQDRIAQWGRYHRWSGTNAVTRNIGIRIAAQ